MPTACPTSAYDSRPSRCNSSMMRASVSSILSGEPMFVVPSGVPACRSLTRPQTQSSEKSRQRSRTAGSEDTPGPRCESSLAYPREIDSEGAVADRVEAVVARGLRSRSRGPASGSRVPWLECPSCRPADAPRGRLALRPYDRVVADPGRRIEPLAHAEQETTVVAGHAEGDRTFGDDDRVVIVGMRLELRSRKVRPGRGLESLIAHSGLQAGSIHGAHRTLPCFAAPPGPAV
jgi:hypothetical protein